MAITGTNRGTNYTSASSSTYDVTPTSSFTANKLAVICVAFTNLNSRTLTSVTDALGNTWTQAWQVNYSSGNSDWGSGTNLAVFYTYQTAGNVLSSTTVTVTFDGTLTHKAYTFTELSSPYKLILLETGTATGEGDLNITTITTTSALDLSHVILGTASNEGGQFNAGGDTDTTRGTWSSSIFGSYTGYTANHTEVLTQYKVITSGGTQTYDIDNGGAAADWIIGYAVFAERKGVLDPMGRSGFFGI